MTYTIKSYSQLNNLDLAAINQLRDVCREQDKYDIPIYEYILKKSRTFSGAHVIYQDGTVVGFLGLFFFYPDACEIALMIHPKMRKKGLAKKLMALALPIIESREMNAIIMTSPADQFTSLFTKKHCTYVHKEYRMVWFPNVLPKLDSGSADYGFSRAKTEDLSDLVSLDKQCFNTHPMDAAHRYHDILSNPEYQVMVVKKDNHIVGKAHLYSQNQALQLSDLAVFPAYQKQGIGRYLLLYCLHNIVYPLGLPVFLEVSLANARALELYQKTGFNTINACDYWKIPLKQFLQKC